MWRLYWWGGEVNVSSYSMLMLFSVSWLSVTPAMDLRPNAGSDRAWVWNTLADYADECPKAESLAIRFLNAESKYLCITPHHLRSTSSSLPVQQEL